jgi:hypothetical protein
VRALVTRGANGRAQSPNDRTAKAGSMGKRLDATLTKVDASTVAGSLTKAWTLTSTAPKRESIAVLLAQSALETGHWRSCHAYNLGNAKATARWEGDFCFYAADEIVNEAQAALALAERAPRTDGGAGHNVELTRLKSGLVQVTLHPDHSWCRFRAFTTLDAAAADYLELLQRRFARAWPAVVAGNPEGFIRTLHEVGYFTASVERYLPPVLQLFKQFNTLLAAPEVPPSAPHAELKLPVSPAGRPTLRHGAKGALVLELQTMLAKQAYEGVPLSGSFDEATRAAVELFQLQHVDEKGLALKSDGEVGPKTWWALLNPSGDAQRSFLPAPSTQGLTPTRKSLLAALDAEHRKPVFETPDGSNRSRDIDAYFGETGIRGKPWCCAFVSWALAQTLGKPPIKSTHYVGVQLMWVAAKELGWEEQQPKPGDVFVQLKSAGTGHTGFVVGVSADGETIYTCEGNCGNRVKYGQRPRASIHHFIDVLRDGQEQTFARGTNLKLDDVSDERTV